MKRRIIALGLIAALSIVSLTGCIKVVKIGEEGKLTGDVAFNAGDNVAGIWESAVLPELEEKAIELSTFLTEANGDLKSLVDKYGKYSMGTSGEINYVIKGTATVEEVENEKKAGYLTLKPEGDSTQVVIKLQIGSVYKGSSVRDSLDIISFGDYTNQEEWAAVSQSLHQIIDEKVIKPADPANLKGKTVTFMGTFTASKDDELLITPVVLSVKMRRIAYANK